MKTIFPDYKNSILNVTNSILKYYNVKTNYPSLPTVDKSLSDSYDHIVYILLDGLGVNIIKHHLEAEDALKKYLSQTITSVFPSTTVAATNAVISGTPPIVNGHLGWVQYFEKEDTNLVVFQNTDFYTGVKQKEDLRSKYLSYPRMIEQIKAINPMITTNEFFPSFAPNGSESFLEEIDKALITMHNNDQTFSYIYWIEPDLTEHKYGIYSNEVKTVLQNLNKNFTSFINNVPENTIVIAIADHGLTDIEEINLYQYDELIDMLVRKTSIEPRVTNFFVKPAFHKAFENTFNALFEGKFKLFKTKDLLDLKWFGEGNHHKMIPSFLGDYISVAMDKYMFSLTDKKSYKAHHAGLTSDEMEVPLIIYKKNKVRLTLFFIALYQYNNSYY